MIIHILVSLFLHHATVKTITVNANNANTIFKNVPDLYLGEKFQVVYKNNKIVKITEVN